MAIGKSIEELKAAGVPESLLEHKHFTGDRPSLSLLFKGSLTAFNCGQLLSIYEHRVATEGFIFNCNSFDQWGVELGKVLAKQTRTVLSAHENGEPNPIPAGQFNEATTAMLEFYLKSQ